jgi:hypothetical protein
VSDNHDRTLCHIVDLIGDAFVGFTMHLDQ